ncbi:MAG: J domain-containing protein [Mycobacteriales bacterium]
MSWVWLSPPRLDFGESRAQDGVELIVWLHADPYTLLQVDPSSDRESIRRGYRRTARALHPDAGADPDAFTQLHGALEAALGEGNAEVSVQPTAGAWWSFAGFVSPAVPDRQPGRGAVVGLAFELHDLDYVPLRDPEEIVRVTYCGQVAPLALSYSRSSRALPVLRRKAAALLESAFLVLLCLTLTPLLAVALSLESYFFSSGSVLLFWSVMVATVGIGYGALAAALVTAGRPVPYPRRAVARIRGKRRDRPLALPRGQN